MDYLLSLLSEYGQHQTLAQAGAAFLVAVVIIAAIIFMVAWRQAALSRRIDRQQAEVRDDIGKLRTVIAEAVSGKWAPMEAKLSGALRDAATGLEKQQQQQAAAAAEILQKQNALLESLAATINQSLQTLDERQKQNGEALARSVADMREGIGESLAKAEQQQQAAAADNKKMTDDYGVYIHDQSAALTAAQERTLSSAAGQLRQSAEALAQTEQNTAGFAERVSADINRRLDDIDKRVQLTLATFENLDGKLALLREVQDEVNRAGKDIGALSQMLTLAAAAVSAKER
ncbi:MAG: hypothetical protein ACR2P4_06205 [Gammaproteobacteria bacterium]